MPRLSRRDAFNDDILDSDLNGRNNFVALA